MTDVLGVDHPVMLGGMTAAGNPELAAAVTEAGGLGVVGTGNMNPDEFEAAVERTRELTDGPIGVNVYYRSQYADDLVDAACRYEVDVLVSGAGNPGKHAAKLQDAGVTLVPVVATSTIARRLESRGAEAVIAEGSECGGHVGEMSSVALTASVADAVDVPVISAGGFTDGRGLAAALALGAGGVQMGTRFVCAEECVAHPRFKQEIVESRDRDTVVVGEDALPVRVLDNGFVDDFRELEASGADEHELRRFEEERLYDAVIDGDVEQGAVMVGQSAANVDEVKPARQIVEEIVADAEEVMHATAGRIA